MHRSDFVLDSLLTSLCANMLMETRFCVDVFQVFAASMQCVAIKKEKKILTTYMPSYPKPRLGTTHSLETLRPFFSFDFTFAP